MLIPRLILLTTFFISACSAPVQAVTDYIHFKRGASQAAVAQTQLDPAFQYLLVTVKGKSFLMARGAVEASSTGPVEVWFSGNREVLKIENGRIIAAAGTPTEWSAVWLSSQPDWTLIKNPIRLERHRDVMPNYHFGLLDTLIVEPITAPASTDFYGRTPPNLHWFQEISLGRDALPKSRYAVSFAGDKAEVIYSEQCLSASLCFSWQRWPNKS